MATEPLAPESSRSSRTVSPSMASAPLHSAMDPLECLQQAAFTVCPADVVTGQTPNAAQFAQHVLLYHQPAAQPAAAAIPQYLPATRTVPACMPSPPSTAPSPPAIRSPMKPKPKPKPKPVAKPTVVTVPDYSNRRVALLFKDAKTSNYSFGIITGHNGRKYEVTFPWHKADECELLDQHETEQAMQVYDKMAYEALLESTKPRKRRFKELTTAPTATLKRTKSSDTKSLRAKQAAAPPGVVVKLMANDEPELPALQSPPSVNCRVLVDCGDNGLHQGYITEMGSGRGDNRQVKITYPGDGDEGWCSVGCLRECVDQECSNW